MTIEIIRIMYLLCFNLCVKSSPYTEITQKIGNRMNRYLASRNSLPYAYIAGRIMKIDKIIRYTRLGFLVLIRRYTPPGNRTIKMGIEIKPRNLNVLKNRLEVKVSNVSDLVGSGSACVDSSIRFVRYEVDGEVKTSNTWLVNPSTLFDSILSVAVGSKIKIKIRMNRGYLIYEIFSLRNRMKKIMDKGIRSNNDSYLTIDDNARKINDKRNSFLFLSKANISINVIRKINNDSAIPKIEFSINWWLKPNKPAPISEYFGETNFLQRK